MMNALTIADVAIRTDAEGRYCLNDLHRASGGEQRHQPRYWLANQQTQDLIAELGDSGNPLSVQKGGSEQGTFVAKELVYAYAMWISAAFHLRVIRAYDAMVSQPHFAIPQTLPEALRLAADLAEQNKALETRVAEQAPKVQALERISDAEGSLCMRDAAKTLQVRPVDLKNWLIVNRWIYGRPGHSGWLAYQDRIQQGVMCHKVSAVQREDGTEKIVEQPRITPKGLARIAEQLRQKAA
jgi:phage antirepressor YoqD-like protein